MPVMKNDAKKIVIIIYCKNICKDDDGDGYHADICADSHIANEVGENLSDWIGQLMESNNGCFIRDVIVRDIDVSAKSM